jgi:hypothetical protein
MQGVLACIDADGVSDCSGCLMEHSDVLLVLLSPRSSSERFGAGARPVHPIRVNARHAALRSLSERSGSRPATKSVENDPLLPWTEMSAM